MKSSPQHLLLSGLFGVVMMLCASCSSSRLSSSSDQSTPRSTVLLFKMDLDSNDIVAATKLLAHPSGRTYVAVEQYELRDEVSRLQRIFNHATLTGISSSDCTEKACQLIVEFDYNNKYAVQTSRIGDRWFITSIGENAAQDE